MSFCIHIKWDLVIILQIKVVSFLFIYSFLFLAWQTDKSNWTEKKFIIKNFNY